MSGRYSFTAGNTLTAAQLNTNVMDGIPYRMIAGYGSITGSLAVTFPVSFTTDVRPILTATLHSASSSSTSITTGTQSHTGVTFYAWNGTSANSTSRNFSYIAIQMTPTTGTGNS